MDVISMRDFSKEQILAILDVASDIKRALHDKSAADQFKLKYGKDVHKILEGKKVATLFLENSTRTNFSFRAAAATGGAFVDGFPTKAYTSLKKGETWAHTVAMFAGYGYDALVMRSTQEGLPVWTKQSLLDNNSHMSEQHASFGSPYSYKAPMVLNGGDGRNQHPTQCLLDLFTMREIAKAHGKSLDGMHLGLLNDLKYGRTNASLMSVAPLFNFTLHFAYPDRFGPPQGKLRYLKAKGVKMIDHGENFMQAMRQSFIAYHSRPQKERVGAGEDLASIKQKGQITKSMYDQLNDQAPYLMHPLPIDAETFMEIAPDMWDHPKNVTKLQSSNGLYVRMALLAIGTGRIKVDCNGSKKKQKRRTQTQEITPKENTKMLHNPRSGYIENEGIVIDHVPAGMGRRLVGVLGLEKEKVPKVITDHVTGKDNSTKDIIKIHCSYVLDQRQLEAISLIAPNATINVISKAKVARKFRTICANYVTGRVVCTNSGCITNVEKEHITSAHFVEKEGSQTFLVCEYCECQDTVNNAYEENRLMYIGGN